MAFFMSWWERVGWRALPLPPFPRRIFLVCIMPPVPAPGVEAWNGRAREGAKGMRRKSSLIIVAVFFSWLEGMSSSAHAETIDLVEVTKQIRGQVVQVVVSTPDGKNAWLGSGFWLNDKDWSQLAGMLSVVIRLEVLKYDPPLIRCSPFQNASV